MYVQDTADAIELRDVDATGYSPTVAYQTAQQQQQGTALWDTAKKLWGTATGGGISLPSASTVPSPKGPGTFDKILGSITDIGKVFVQTKYGKDTSPNQPQTASIMGIPLWLMIGGGVIATVLLLKGKKRKKGRR